jgi:hypothetical protein
LTAGAAVMGMWIASHTHPFTWRYSISRADHLFLVSSGGRLTFRRQSIRGEEPTAPKNRISQLSFMTTLDPDGAAYEFATADFDEYTVLAGGKVVGWTSFSAFDERAHKQLGFSFSSPSLRMQVQPPTSGRGSPVIACFDSRSYVFPHWFAAAVFFVPFAALLFVRIRRRRAIRPGCCLSCGYDLRATPDRWPECGSVPSMNL